MATKAPKPIGTITHYFGGLGVAIIKLATKLESGTDVSFKGATTDFTQTVESMQYDHQDISIGKKGQEIGVKVKDKVREGDEVFLVE